MTVALDKEIIVIAGPNGAVETTFAGEFLPNEAGCPNFVDAEIALKRAAHKAREIARKAGTSVVILKDGEIREEQGDNHAHSDH